MTLQGFVVPPLSRSDIRKIALSIRKEIGLQEPYFPIVEFIELILPRLISGFYFDIMSESEMGPVHGATFPEKSLIQIREDVYDGACNGNGRDRFTIAHEVGHFFLHGEAVLTRRFDGKQLPRYKDSEWQADCFAGELLVPIFLKEEALTPQYIQSQCGVSEDAANCVKKLWGKE